jgi:hypothetical protein
LLVKHLNAKPPEPSAFNPNVTPEADRFILRMLAKKPAQRPKDMAEVGAELRSLKVFKRDPFELAAEEEERRRKEGLGLGAKMRLDSRADAARSELGLPPEPKPEPRKPTAAALAAAARQQSRTGQAPPAYSQPTSYPGYEAAAWAGYGQAYPPNYWPQYGSQGTPQVPPPQAGYYPYPPPGPPPAAGELSPVWPQPQAAQAMPQHDSPQPAVPQWGAVQPAPVPAQPSAPGTPPPGTGPAQPHSAAKPAPAAYVPGQGRPLDERHPTQQGVEDPDAIPLMDAEELPDVL